ncbi:MAG TPA: cupredoxin domain-containing protein [Chloroflexota bacterium]
MTISGEQASTPQGDRPQPGHTFPRAMTGAGCWAVAAGVAYFLAYVIVVYTAEAGDERTVADLRPVFALSSVAAVFGIIGGLSLFWSGARRRAWFWLVPAVLAVLVLTMNAPYIPYDLARPANTSRFLLAIVVLGGALAAIVGGVAAFLEIRRARRIWTSDGPAGRVSMIAIGIVLGAALTSLLAGLALGGAGVPEAPTSTDVITVSDMRFVENTLYMKVGEVLGLFVTNPTEVGHSFDVDNLDLHVLLPPHSTTAVALHPRGPGTFEFYCGVAGHRAGGMVGAIVVD